MEHRRPILCWLCPPVKPALAVALFLSCSTEFAHSVSAASPDNENEYRSHRTFVMDHLDTLTRDVLSEFPFQRGRPLRIAATTPSRADSLFEEVLARAFVGAGFLVASSGSGADSVTPWNLQYDLERYTLELTDPTRRSFLGKIWLRRTLAVLVQLQLRRTDENDLLWTHRIDTTFQDWIPKRAARRMAEAGTMLFAPAVPSTSLERLTIPVLAGAVGGSVVILFLVLH